MRHEVFATDRTTQLMRSFVVLLSDWRFAQVPLRSGDEGVHRHMFVGSSPSMIARNILSASLWTTEQFSMSMTKALAIAAHLRRSAYIALAIK
jgi:hypothetical protein